jgi:hypothetical protein
VSVPDHFHFIFGLKPQTEPFHIAWYLCLRSCQVVNNPSQISFYYVNEPHGEWWERIKPSLNLIKLDNDSAVFDTGLYQTHEEGRFIERAGLQYAHQADFLRLLILATNGGVYADIDTLFVTPYPASFYSYPCVMGLEAADSDPPTICNALIMAEPESVFVSTWLERMQAVFDGSWNRHSCVEPALLSQSMPEQIHVVPPTPFFHFRYDRMGLIALFGRKAEVPEDLCSIHMWSHLWWEPWRTDFIPFHHGQLTEKFIREVDTTYNLIARRYLD